MKLWQMYSILATMLNAHADKVYADGIELYNAINQVAQQSNTIAVALFTDEDKRDAGDKMMMHVNTCYGDTKDVCEAIRHLSMSCTGTINETPLLKAMDRWWRLIRQAEANTTGDEYSVAVCSRCGAVYDFAGEECEVCRASKANIFIKIRGAKQA